MSWIALIFKYPDEYGPSLLVVDVGTVCWRWHCVLTVALCVDAGTVCWRWHCVLTLALCVDRWTTRPKCAVTQTSHASVNNILMWATSSTCTPSQTTTTSASPSSSHTETSPAAPSVSPGSAHPRVGLHLHLSQSLWVKSLMWTCVCVCWFCSGDVLAGANTLMCIHVLILQWWCVCRS